MTIRMDALTGVDERKEALALDGRRVAEEIKREVFEDVERLKHEHGYTPCLSVIIAGQDPASIVYVRNKVRTCEELGLRSERYELPEEVTTGELLALIETLNAREDVDGVLVQSPLPAQCDQGRVVEAINPAKDVDGFHPVNVGRFILKQPALVPCTPSGIIELLVREGVGISGAHACVVGRSNIVGRPMAELLLQRDATVTICHSRTRNLAAVTRQADILVAAIGRAGFIRAEHVKPGATVIDVGMNRVTEAEVVRDLFGEQAEKRLNVLRERGYTLVGDVHPAEVGQVAGRLTPVPGGVGLLTIAMLMRNTALAARRRRGIENRQSSIAT